MFVYVVVAIGALWGILTLYSFRVEDEYIKELVDSASKASNKKMTKQSHGSEWLK